MKMGLPGHLSRKAREWVEVILKDYDLEPHQVEILIQAGATWDRIEKSRKQIEKDGAYIRGHLGCLKSHPALADERNGRVVFARLLRELNLEVEGPDVRLPRLGRRS
jgi:hypothetical protein